MRGEPAFWMGAKETLASAHRSAPFGSWWTDVPRDGWEGALHARWRGPAPEAKKSIAWLGLGRRRVPPSKRKRRGR